MQLIPSMELNRATGGRERTSSTPAETDRLIELSSWMMVLATIRIFCVIADYMNAFLESAQGRLPSVRMVVRFFQENQPLLALGVVWPLFLAVALRRTRWPELLRATTATFLVLSICGVLEFVAVWAHTRSTVLNVGSFHLPRRALTTPLFSDLVLGLLGTTQLLVELGVAIWSMLLATRFRRSVPADSNKQLSARRALFGRLAFFVSLAFFVLVIRSSVWSAYLEVVNQSALVREFVLRNDFERIRSRHSRPRGTAETAQERQARQMQATYDSGTRAWEEGRFAAARHAYFDVIAQVESIPPELRAGGYQYAVVYAFNNLAWLLATCADVSLRDSQGAVTYAKRAVALAPMDRKCWNTLGVAYYRAGDLEEAKNALYRSMDLRNEGDSFDWFFLAMLHFKLGHKDRGREWYERAASQLQRIGQGGVGPTLDQLDELYRFQIEAAEVIGLRRPAPPISMLGDAIGYPGTEVVGVPVPAMTSATRKVLRNRNISPLDSLLRLNRRMPGSGAPARQVRPVR